MPSNILLVEDDPDIRESVAEILTIEGFSVAVAGNGQEGLDILSRIGPPCLVLLDLMMPVMSGLEFLSRVKADPLLRDCTVVLMTASHVQLPPGAAEFIRKPFDFSELVALANRHCS
ncbi:response regulator [Corallococcus exiguus]|uniref:Response regulator n=1 Tax=Corallococcus exiguus TaxID=83462 RepID=A0A7X4YJA4_9BACT|nr:response regulator [Corallococcus exiguus]NBC46315.1 response regulator [Corallococcus exiguus]TNV62528.1 response regulator [Corallococcus exiguus]